MSHKENIIQRTQHAFLVAWGWFAEHIGMPEQIEAVNLKQKSVGWVERRETQPSFHTQINLQHFP